ncbi:hypothetical protein FB451DRAFT_507226 [Mycena latifolia]|nr:hypothetical protein FB451DRAFT_507226 [Mycena latifolia]
MKEMLIMLAALRRVGAFKFCSKLRSSVSHWTFLSRHRTLIKQMHPWLWNFSWEYILPISPCPPSQTREYLSWSTPLYSHSCIRCTLVSFQHPHPHALTETKTKSGDVSSVCHPANSLRRRVQLGEFRGRAVQSAAANRSRTACCDSLATPPPVRPSLLLLRKADRFHRIWAPHAEALKFDRQLDGRVAR